VFTIRCSWLTVGALVICCGGESKSGRNRGNDAPSTAEANTAGGVPTGGVGGAGRSCCPIVIAGAGGDVGICDAATLWRDIGTADGYLVCRPANPNLDPAEKRGPGRGAVVLDGDGRVIDNTGLDGDAKQAWLAQLADQRWPCMAGETLGYSCSSHD